jgi:hypothetical protein
MKDSSSIQHSRSRGVVLLLCGFLLGVLLLFAEETAASCRIACHNRYKAYYDDCWTAHCGDPEELANCYKMVSDRIATCYAGCGE